MLTEDENSTFFSKTTKEDESEKYQILRDKIESNGKYQKEIMTINDMKEKLMQIRRPMSPEPIIAKLKATTTKTIYGYARFVRVPNGIDGMRAVCIDMIKIELMKQSGTINYYQVKAQGNDKVLKETEIGNLPQRLGLDRAPSAYQAPSMKM